MSAHYKTPVSVLVVIHTPDRQVLLIERADHAGWWQSVTGSQEAGESLLQTVAREVQEETGLRVAEHRLSDGGYHTDYAIYACYQHRYAPGTTHNREHVFALEVAAPMAVVLNPEEHTAQRWLPWFDAAEACFSPSNAAAIQRVGCHDGA